LLALIVDRVNVGLFILDAEYRVLLWNSFMAANSGKSASEIIGKNLFDVFPELPERWFSRKVSSVFMLKNFAFTSWEQRSHLFQFRHNRPVTSGIEYMCQDITLMPIKNQEGEVESVCVTLQDTTDTARYRMMHEAAVEKLEIASRTDGLTQLFNRAHWQSRLQEEVIRAARYELGLSMLLFDLDHFKSINDQYGHPAGDAVLVAVAQIIRSCLRESDFAGRYGGEEFGVILPSTNVVGAMVVAERLRRQIEAQEIQCDSTTIHVSASIGVVEFGGDVVSVERLIAKADEALYQAKAAGRNRVVQAH
jgi:diguanylate cyclase (GGDEF)-like protein